MGAAGVLNRTFLLDGLQTATLWSLIALRWLLGSEHTAVAEVHETLGIMA